MSQWQAGDLQANGIKIHYTRTGGQKRPLVLLHGFTDDGLCWSPIAQALESEYDVIMLDTRGHGLSDAPESGYTPDSLAADLRGAIAALHLEKPAILGHSLGAITTLLLAGLYPDIPGPILLEDPPPWWIPLPEAAFKDVDKGAETLRQSLIQRKSKTREQLIDEEHLNSPSWSDAELGPWADSKLRLSPNIFMAVDPRSAISQDWRTVLPRVTCPTLLIMADPALGAIVTPEAESALRELVPQVQSVVIAGAGHSIHREQMAAYLEQVRKFLAEHYR